MKKLLAGWRHPLRVVAMSMAALSLAWGVALTEGLVAAMVGAALGVVAGELLGRSRLRLGVVAGGLWLLVLVAWKLGAVALGTEALPDAVGPGNALAAVGVLRFGSLAFGLIAAVRAVAVRRPAALAVEVGLIAAAVTGVFASHRDGVIARPLWLSDWAWQQGIDPAQVFLTIGAVSIGLLCILLVAETKSGRALSSLVALALLAFLGVSIVNVVGAPTPNSENVLGTNDAGSGGPPRHTGADGGHGPGGEDPGDAGDGGRRDPRSDDGGGRGPDGGDDAAFDGGSMDGGDGGAGFDVIDGGDGGASAMDGGDGAASAGGDASDGGDGASGGGGQDGGDGASGGGGQDGGDGSSSGSDGAGDMPMPMYPTDGAIDPNVPPPQDGGDFSPPPPSDQFNNNDGPSRSPYPVAVVVFDDDYSPPSGAYYFRQEIWSQIAGPRLVKTSRNDVDLDVADEFPTVSQRLREVPSTRGRTRVDARVALLVRNQTFPFGLESVVTFAPSQNPNPQRFTRAYRFSSLAQSISLRDLINVAGHGAPPPIDLAEDAGADAATDASDAAGDASDATRDAPDVLDAMGDVVTDAPADAPRDARASRDGGAGGAGVQWTSDVLRYYTTPHADPRFRQLALRVLEEQYAELHIPPRMRDNQVVQASLINRWAYKEFIYSTRERHANVPDPTIDFLFGNRTGYCVHFAHAAVFLWRSLGIPSRISTGYHSDEGNRRSGSSLIIRGGDAHAWPELFVRDHGWIVLDVAAERNLDPPGTPPDEDLQRILGEMARQLPPEPDAPPATERPRPRPRYGRAVGYGVLGLLFATLFAMYFVKGWRRLAPRLAGPKALPRVAYRAALDRLAEAGLSREFGESREAFAARVKATAPTFAEMTALHVSARLGDPARDPGATPAFSAEKWRALSRSFARELAAGTKRWRRILGLLHPAAWLDAR